MDVTADFVSITPEIAAEYLKNNTSNYRRLYKSTVAQYAKSMKDGLWKENGEAIQFDESGALLNGQHRLNAIIASGTTQKMLVVRGIKDGTIYDRGKARSWGDYTNALIGKPLSNVMSGTLAVLLGNLKDHGRVSFENRYAYYCKHSEALEKATSYVNRGSSAPIMRKSGCVAAIYCAIRLGIVTEIQAETFCKIVNSGFAEDNCTNEPAIALKHTLEKTVGTSYPFMKTCFDITYQALTAFAKNKKSKRNFHEIGIAKTIIDNTLSLDESTDIEATT